MIQFNELRISPNGKCLIIDAMVKNEEYYNNIILGSVIIDTQDTYVVGGPSATPAFTYVIKESYDYVYSLPGNLYNPVLEEENQSYCFTYHSSEVEGMKHVRLYLTEQDLGIDLNNNMLFVYVTTEGTPAANTPCGMDNAFTMGTVVNMFPFYQKGMSYVKELVDSCAVPKNFIDYILKIKGLELAIRTGNYIEAIKHYNKHFKGLEEAINNKGGYNCGCSG